MLFIRLYANEIRGVYYAENWEEVVDLVERNGF